MGNNISIHEIEGNEQHAHELIKIMDDNQALPIQEIVSRLIEKWEGSKETFNLLKINLNETRRKELKTYCKNHGLKMVYVVEQLIKKKLKIT